MSIRIDSWLGTVLGVSLALAVAFTTILRASLLVFMAEHGWLKRAETSIFGRSQPPKRDQSGLTGMQRSRMWRPSGSCWGSLR